MHPQFIEPVDQPEANVHGDAAIRRSLGLQPGPRALSGTLLRSIHRWPRLTDGHEDEQNDQGEQDEMADQRCSGRRVQITFNDEREHCWGRQRVQFAIDGLHYPLFWAAFHPGLGCFISSAETVVVTALNN